MEARSLPAFGSVMAMAVTRSPDTQPGQVSPLELLRGIGGDVGNDDVAVQRRGQPGGAGPDQFLGHDDRIEEIRPQAAVLLRHLHAEEPLGAHLPPHGFGDDAALLPLQGLGGHLGLQEFPQSLPEEAVFFGVVQDFQGNLTPPWAQGRRVSAGAVNDQIGEQLPLHLRRLQEKVEGLGVAVETLHLPLGHVPQAAVDLDRFGGHPEGGL